jgi:hypothetical protein
MARENIDLCMVNSPVRTEVRHITALATARDRVSRQPASSNDEPLRPSAVGNDVG